jgi:hypothetical protein
MGCIIKMQSMLCIQKSMSIQKCKNLSNDNKANYIIRSPWNGCSKFLYCYWIYSKQSFHSISQVDWMLPGYWEKSHCVVSQYNTANSHHYSHIATRIPSCMWKCTTVYRGKGIIVITCCPEEQDATVACLYILLQHRNNAVSIPWLLQSPLLTRSDGFPSCEQHGRQKRNQQQIFNPTFVFHRTSTSNHIGDRVNNKKTEENLSTTVSCIHSLRQDPLIANVDRMNTVCQSWQGKSSN